MDYSKKTKEELIKEIENFKQKEQHVEFILDRINEMFYKVSVDENNVKTIEYLSPQVENVFGLTHDEYFINQDWDSNLLKEINKNKNSTSISCNSILSIPETTSFLSNSTEVPQKKRKHTAKICPNLPVKKSFYDEEIIYLSKCDDEDEEVEIF